MVETTSETKQPLFSKHGAKHLAISVFMLAALFYIYSTIVGIVPSFIELSNEFNAEAPAITQFIYNNYGLYSYLAYAAVISFVVYFIFAYSSGLDDKCFKKVAAINLVASAVIAMTTFIFLYLPILKASGSV